MKTLLLKKRWFILLAGFICMLYQADAQSYLINFTGNNPVDSVFAENTQKGITVKLAGNETLKLMNVPTGFAAPEVNTPASLRVFPNPVYDGNCKIQFSLPAAEDVKFSLYDISGKLLFSKFLFLPEEDNALSLSNLGEGVYVARIIFGQKVYSTRIISHSFSSGNIRLNNEYSDAPSPIAPNPFWIKTSSNENVIPMHYMSGDIIKLTGKSGNYRTVIISDPQKDTVIDFNFVPCADVDGNQYLVVKLGNQIWMAENLRTTKYNDGTPIWGISGFHSTNPGYTVYANSNSNRITYGLLYNWYAVETEKLAPEGWRIPTKEDWETLIEHLGGKEVAGGKLKESGLDHWKSPNTGTVDCGFTGLPSGIRDGGSASYMHLLNRGYWWSSTLISERNYAYAMGLVSWGATAGIYEEYKPSAFSIRCIKDE